MAHLLRVVLAWLLIMATPAFADGGPFPATPGEWNTSYCNPANFPKPHYFGSEGAWLCKEPASANPNLRNCGWMPNNPAGYHGSCNQSKGAPSCPAGANSGTSATGEPICTCGAGLSPENGQCVAPNKDKDACFKLSGLGNLLGGVFTQDYRYQGRVEDGIQFCMVNPFGEMSSPSKGCKVTFTRGALLGYGDSVFVTEGTLSMDPNSNLVDQSCDIGPNEQPKPAPPKEKCPNGYTGTVNGVEVCVSKKPDNGVGDQNSETEENNGEETRRTRTESRTECKNGTCTTTTTTTTTIINNSTGASSTSTSTNTTTQPQEGFCQANPRAKLCSDGDEDGSSFSGACGGGFACEGDAIQCAIAQEQHRRACKLFDDQSPESQLYNDNKGKTGNQTGSLPGNETVNLAGRINSTDALGAGSTGIADLNVTVWGQSISLPFSQLNPYLSHLGNILLAVSFLLAVRIITRG